uniref:Cellular repressor of E1A stimulateds 2 n=1 Tax=Cyanistes caeruleus TaxID=156563 RepID=A0A8C0VFL4_CYACU
RRQKRPVILPQLLEILLNHVIVTLLVYALTRNPQWNYSRNIVCSYLPPDRIQGMPYGNCLLLSDGPVNNSTGIPFFYVTPKDSTVTDLLKNPMFYLPSTTFNEWWCSHILGFTLAEHTKLKKKAEYAYALAHLLTFFLFVFLCPSRHPVVRKWPRSYEWFFMKMNIEHIWLQSWYGEVSPIAVEEYLKAVPSKG